jgi:general stress protein 26
MLNAEDGKEARDIGRILAGAKEIVASVQYCWLISRADGSVRARPMGRILSRPAEDRWTVRFITNRRSRKAADMVRSAAIYLIFQKDRDDAFVGASGTARLIEAAPEVQALWNEGVYSKYFPTEEDRANVGFVELKITRLELWIRDVTPEPFGLQATILQRDPQGDWTLAHDM